MSDSFGFQVISPQAIDDAALLSTNVVETAPALYDGGTTYAANATAGVSGPANAIDVYTSLEAGNVGHAPASSPTWWKKTGSTFGVFDLGHTYADLDFALDATNHLIYQGVGAGNVGNALPDPPGSNNDKWLFVRASNARAMFDQSNSTQTINPDEIHVSLRADGMVNGVAARNISAATVRVVQTDDVEGVVFDQTFDMISESGIDDFGPYFFTPPVRRKYLPLVELYPYADSTIDLYFDDPGADVAVGVAVIGYIQEIGGTQWGPTVGYTDYSSIGPNTYGDRDIIKRGFTDDGSFVLWTDNDGMDDVMDFFKSSRATALLFQADDRWGVMQIFGIVTACSLAVPGDTKSALSLTLSGLT